MHTTVNIRVVMLVVAANGVDHHLRLLRRGGVVAFPTETVYGLGANALNPSAVARIFELKRRPLFDPLIVHVASIAQAEALAELARVAAQLKILEKLRKIRG